MKVVKEWAKALWFVAHVLWFGIRIKLVERRQDKIDAEWDNIRAYAQRCKKKWSYFETEVREFYKKPL